VLTKTDRRPKLDAAHIFKDLYLGAMALDFDDLPFQFDRRREANHAYFALPNIASKFYLKKTSKGFNNVTLWFIHRDTLMSGLLSSDSKP